MGVALDDVIQCIQEKGSDDGMYGSYDDDKDEDDVDRRNMTTLQALSIDYEISSSELHTRFV